MERMVRGCECGNTFLVQRYGQDTCAPCGKLAEIHAEHRRKIDDLIMDFNAAIGRIWDVAEPDKRALKSTLEYKLKKIEGLCDDSMPNAEDYYLDA